MEERKARLAEQLAKLNAEILTSDLIPHVLSPKPKRRRISDFHAVGMGTPKKGTDRRAVSNKIQVIEEEPVSIKVRDQHGPADKSHSTMKLLLR